MDRLDGRGTISFKDVSLAASSSLDHAATTLSPRRMLLRVPNGETIFVRGTAHGSDFTIQEASDFPEIARHGIDRVVLLPSGTHVRVSNIIG